MHPVKFFLHKNTLNNYFLKLISLTKLQFKLYSGALKMKVKDEYLEHFFVWNKIPIVIQIKAVVLPGIDWKRAQTIFWGDENVLHFSWGDCYTDTYNTCIRTQGIVLCMSLYINFNSPKKIKYTHPLHNLPCICVHICTCRYIFFNVFIIIKVSPPSWILATVTLSLHCIFSLVALVIENNCANLSCLPVSLLHQ